MNILYDHQIFSNQVYGGISKYFCEIINSLKTRQNFKYKLPIFYTRNHHIKYFNLSPTLCSPLQFKGGIRAGILLNKQYSKFQISRGNYDLLHPTYYDPYFLDFKKNKPYVLTVYDMIHEKFPHYFSSNDQTIERKKLLVENADAIIAISENTKKDLIEIYNLDINKKPIYTTPLGFSRTSGLVSSDTSINYSNYLLFVGNRDVYKNFNTMISAIARILRNDKNLTLICAGGGNFTSEENSLIEKYKIREKVIHLTPSDLQLEYLYKNAKCFIFPSIYEGFGLPVLEAMNNGCPIALSNASSFPEIAGDAGKYFDPLNPSSIESCVEEILHPDYDLNDYLNKSKKRCEIFTWENCANKTYEAYSATIKS